MTSVIRHLGVPLTKPMADALFTGCATDTGCFRYSNTTANTLRTAADLIDAGADSAVSPTISLKPFPASA